MLNITLGIIFGLLFFTYKPLFRNLKESKFQYKAFMELIKREERKKEFKAFARFQLDKVKVCIQKCLDFISKKENNPQTPQAQPLAKEENTQTSAENAESSVSIQKTEQAKEQVAEQIETKEAESKDSLNALKNEKDIQSVENTQNVNESKNKE